MELGKALVRAAPGVLAEPQLRGGRGRVSTEANAECLNEAAVMPPYPEELFIVAEEMQRALLLSTAPFSTSLPIQENFSMDGLRRRTQSHPQGPLDLLGPSSSRFPRTSAARGVLVLCTAWIKRD